MKGCAEYGGFATLAGDVGRLFVLPAGMRDFIGVGVEVWKKSNRFLKYYTQPNKPTKRGKKDDYIDHLKYQRKELQMGLEFAMTLIPTDKLPQGISYQSFRWLINRGREMEYTEPRMLGVSENDQARVLGNDCGEYDRL